MREVGICYGRLAAVAVSLCLAASVFADAPAAQSVEELRAKAQQIVTQLTPEKTVWLRGFHSGLRVCGVSVSHSTSDAPQSTGAPSLSVQLPEWLQAPQLLGTLHPKDPTPLRVLWKVDPRENPLPETQQFSVRVTNHQGYATQNQADERTTVQPAAHPYGTMFWTDHRIPSLENYPPGLYDLFVGSLDAPQESIPVGQMLYVGDVEPDTKTEQQARSLCSGGAIELAGSAVLARWVHLRVPIAEVPFEPRHIVLVSNADWLEDMENLTPIATLTVKDKQGGHDDHPILLGRDTSSAWYDLHARGNVRHSKAPIAWSWSERQDTVDFEASVYQAKYDLTGVKTPLDSIDIAYTLDKGVLHIRAIVLLP